MFKARLSDILRSPSSLMAIIGLAFLAMAREAHRYPVLASVDKMGFIAFPVGESSLELTTLITFATLVIAFLILTRTGGAGAVFSPAAGLVAALIMTLGYAGKFVLSNVIVLRVCSEFTQACGFFILIAWTVLLYKNERERTLLLVAYSFLLSGILQALLAILVPQAGILLCTMAPILSVLLLWLYRYTYDVNDLVWGTRTKLGPDTVMSERFAPLGKILSPRATALVLLCFCIYGIVCITQSSTWLGAQSLRQAAPLLIQVFSALGTILAAVVLIALVHKEFNVWNDVVYKALIFTVFALSLVVSSFSQNYSLAAVFTTFVDAGYKFILFFIWMFPLALQRGKGNISVFVELHMVFALGLILGRLAAVTSVVRFVVTFVGLLVLVIDLLFALTRTMGASSQNAPVKTDSVRLKELEAREAEARAAEQEAQDTLEKYRHILFMVYLSETFQFTQREFEVFPYFVDGVKTKDIASTLYISQETVRTHRRNVYQKMDVHSQEELQTKVRTLRETDFPAFLANVSATAR